MSYKKIPINKKIEAVKRVVDGEKITTVAKELNIDRNSLGIWRRRFMDLLPVIFDRKLRKRMCLN